MSVFSGCGTSGPDVTREEALAEMLRHAGAVAAMLEGELVDDYPPERRMFPCLGDGEQWTLSRRGTVIGSAEEDTERVAAYFRGRGFSVRIRDAGQYGFDVLATGADGLRMQLGLGLNGYADLAAQSPCFPEQR